jgi:hypothetical protein
MEEKAKVEDRRLLARLVLVREEARSLLSGGLQDERIEKNKLRNLPEPEVSIQMDSQVFCTTNDASSAFRQ